jgi:hypothetical protein
MTKNRYEAISRKINVTLQIVELIIVVAVAVYFISALLRYPL